MNQPIEEQLVNQLTEEQKTLIRRIELCRAMSLNNITEIYCALRTAGFDISDLKPQDLLEFFNEQLEKDEELKYLVRVMMERELEVEKQLKESIK